MVTIMKRLLVKAQKCFGVDTDLKYPMKLDLPYKTKPFENKVLNYKKTEKPTIV
jgi:hypothetical protein